jgi:Zn-dependent oligopeptidase
MEMWLTEKSTLYALIDLSESETPLSDESIDAAFRVRSHEKALKLAQQSFYGSLELELFSGFDLKGPETIHALKDRLAQKLIPHDVPDKKDLTPLLDILQENAHGRHVAWYRYTWCEVLSAKFFERFKEAYQTNPDETIPKLRANLRRFLLDPGAATDVQGFRSEFGLVDCSPEPLWKRYGL